MTPARRSPSTRTLGSQLLDMSTVLALIDRMYFTASRPMPVKAARRNATVVIIFARIEILASMGSLEIWMSAPDGGNQDRMTQLRLAAVRPQVELTKRTV